MLVIVLGQHLKYKCTCSLYSLTLNVGSYLSLNKDNSNVTFNVNYDFEQINIANITCQHLSQLKFNAGYKSNGKIKH